MSVLKINMLGEFSMSYEGKMINEQSRRSRKMWALMQYMVTYHEREISQNELIELLWPKGDIENPVGALKTQLYRLRTVLDTLGIPGDNIIVNSMGTYAFNNKLDYEIDFNVFEDTYKRGVEALSDKEKLNCFLQALELYKGDFLHKSSNEQWVTPLNAYYHSIFLRIVHESTEILFSFNQFKDVITICRKAIIIDQFDEAIHIMLIKALLEQGDKQAAKTHYTYVMDLYYNQHAINPSPNLVAMYSDIMRSENMNEANVSAIKSELAEKEDAEGAFLCEYDAFKHIYRLEVRESERSGRTSFIALISVTGRDNTQLTPKQINKTMEKLVAAINSSMRTSDVFARYSASQFVLLLPLATEGTCEAVVQRIVKRFRRDNPKSKAILLYGIEIAG